MRVVAQIPHHTLSITIHSYNKKFLLQIEWDNYVQTFKIAEADVYSADQLQAMITDDFLKNCMLRFHQMHQDFLQSYKSIHVK